MKTLSVSKEDVIVVLAKDYPVKLFFSYKNEYLSKMMVNAIAASNPEFTMKDIREIWLGAIWIIKPLVHLLIEKDGLQHIINKHVIKNLDGIEVFE